MRRFRRSLLAKFLLALAGCSHPAADTSPTKQDTPADHLNRGVAYVEQKQFDKAIQEYDEAIRLKPEYSIAYNNRGWARHLKGDEDKAIRDFDKAIELDPKLYERALKDFDEAIRLGPTDEKPFNSRGTVWLAKHDVDAAIKDFDEAIRLDPRYAIAFTNRGSAWTAK